MSGPWEDYQPAGADDGPWADYAPPKQGPTGQTEAAPDNARLFASSMNRGLATGLDTIGNVGPNLVNLGIAGVGGIATAAGRPDLAPQPLELPNLATRGMQAAGVDLDVQPVTQGQKLLSTGAEFAGGALLAPARSGPQLAANLTAGGVSGLAAETAEQATGSPLAGLVASMAVPAGAQYSGQRGAQVRAMNVEKDAIAREARAEGYVFPPSQTGASLPARAVEGASGKVAMEKTASARNEEVTQALAARAIGVKLEDLNPAGLEVARREAGQAYRVIENQKPFVPDLEFRKDISALGRPNRQMAGNVPALANGNVENLLGQLQQNVAFDAPAAVQVIRQLRADASALYRRAEGQNASPGDAQQAKAYRGAATALENLVERRLAAGGNPEIVEQFRAARQRLAKIHSVEDAMNQADGRIDPQALARQLQRGEPLTGELLTIAKTAKSYKNAVRNPTGEGSYPVSKLDYVAALGGGAASAGGLIDPSTALLAGVAPFLVRQGMLSQPYQKIMGPNNYLFSRAAQNVNAPGVAATNFLQQE